ncbi:transglycosylase domain-containing protein [Paeniglutamicibacter gangotriensis]|nr:transglycosylase domain-containing protein [Paeniglutamicibacter gangotriensis]
MAAKKSPFFDTATTLGKIVAFFGVSALCGVLAAGLMVPVASLAGSGATAGAEVFNALPASFKGESIAQPSKILASDGSTIATIYSENRQPVDLDEISPIMRKAIVSIEDERFYEHNGVDIRGIARAAVHNFTSSSQQGASTLTQQYVNNLLINADSVNGVDRSQMTISGSKDIADKAREAKLAISIEKEMTKDEILEGYLNLVLFSGRTYGIQAAAQRFYSVDAKDLNLQQSAMLAGMVQLPNAYNPQTSPERSEKRRNTVLAAMLRTGAIDEKAYDKAVKSDLAPNPHNVKSGCVAVDSAAYFCDYVTRLIAGSDAFGETKKKREELLYRGGLTIKTTLDPRLQKEAEKQSKAMIPADDKSNLGAAIVSVEPGTGNILAMGQNKTYAPSAEDTGRETMYNLAVESTRGGAGGFPGGSTMKPYTSMAWLESGRNMYDKVNASTDYYPQSFKWKASCLPKGHTVATGGWPVGNASPGFKRTMTVDYGLLWSINTATVKEASMLDLCDISQAAARLGVVDQSNFKDVKTGEKTTTPQPIDPSNPSFLLGSADITPLAQATAFAALANRGEFCENRALTSVTDATGNKYKVKPVSCEQVLSPQIAADMNGTMKKIASNRVAKNINAPIAGKTGTNTGASSTWFVGYSTGISTASWVGRYDKNKNLKTMGHEIAGTTRSWVDSATWAAPMWTKYMTNVIDLYPANSFGQAKSAPKPPPKPKSESKDDDKDSESSKPSKSSESKDKDSESDKPKESSESKDKDKGKSENKSSKPSKPKKDD